MRIFDKMKITPVYGAPANRRRLRPTQWNNGSRCIGFKPPSGRRRKSLHVPWHDGLQITALIPIEDGTVIDTG